MKPYRVGLISGTFRSALDPSFRRGDGGGNPCDPAVSGSFWRWHLDPEMERGPGRQPASWPLTRGPRVAKAKAPFPNAVGRREAGPWGPSFLLDNGAASPAPFIEATCAPRM